MFQRLETTLVAVYFWKRLAYWSGLRIMCSSDKTMRYLCDELPTLLSCARGPREGIRLYPLGTRLQLQSETVGMICRRIAGPLVGQESRLRLMPMPINGLGENIILTA